MSMPASSKPKWPACKRLSRRPTTPSTRFEQTTQMLLLYAHNPESNWSGSATNFLLRTNPSRRRFGFSKISWPMRFRTEITQLTHWNNKSLPSKIKLIEYRMKSIASTQSEKKNEHNFQQQQSDYQRRIDSLSQEKQELIRNTRTLQSQKSVLATQVEQLRQEKEQDTQKWQQKETALQKQLQQSKIVVHHLTNCLDVLM